MTKFGAGRGSDTEGEAARNSLPTPSAAYRRCEGCGSTIPVKETTPPSGFVDWCPVDLRGRVLVGDLEWEAINRRFEVYAARELRLAQGLRVIRDTGTEVDRRVAERALVEAGVPDPEDDGGC